MMIHASTRKDRLTRNVNVMSCLLHDDNPDDDSRVSYVPFSIPHPIPSTTASYVAADAGAGNADCDTLSFYEILCLCCTVLPIYSSYMDTPVNKFH